MPQAGRYIVARRRDFNLNLEAALGFAATFTFAPDHPIVLGAAGIWWPVDQREIDAYKADLARAGR